MSTARQPVGQERYFRQRSLSQHPFCRPTLEGGKTYCPSLWSDLRIGSGACGLGCRACFLMLTHRSMKDPLCPLIYNNVEKFWEASCD